MFSKPAIIVLSTVIVFVAAAGPIPAGIRNSCNTGPVQCCNTVKDNDAQTASLIYELFNFKTPVNGKVAFQCSPISGAGGGSGANCATQPVCCSDNHFEGGIAAGCNPVSFMI